MHLPFTKMEGIGNDYVFLDQRNELICPPELLTTEFIQRLSDRNVGIGSDGIVSIEAPQNIEAVARMKMWNADGSSSLMCGNALRCIALHIYLHDGKEEFMVESESGMHQCRIINPDRKKQESIVEINMGQPIFLPSAIPFLSDDESPLIDFTIDVNDKIYRATILSMGNPHCVIFVDDVDSINLEAIGPQLENHPLFPQKTNVEFVSINGDSFLQRTFERGSGETLACGSGACAVAVAGVLTGRGKKKQKIELRGGDLKIEWSGSLENNSDVIMRGLARVVFQGNYTCS